MRKDLNLRRLLPLAASLLLAAPHAGKHDIEVVNVITLQGGHAVKLLGLRDRSIRGRSSDGLDSVLAHVGHQLLTCHDLLVERLRGILSLPRLAPCSALITLSLIRLPHPLLLLRLLRAPQALVGVVLILLLLELGPQVAHSLTRLADDFVRLVTLIGESGDVCDLGILLGANTIQHLFLCRLTRFAIVDHDILFLDTLNDRSPHGVVPLQLLQPVVVQLHVLPALAQLLDLFHSLTLLVDGHGCV
mmetsp:Transcript_1428/g.2861  ORF Transcript_1428/g.2861 Transcript_1428/m.2861 type:complete len:246 (-) Transcript_1428:518-1255(-)